MQEQGKAGALPEELRPSFDRGIQKVGAHPQTLVWIQGWDSD
jgi:hypothetical protein